MKNKLRCYMKKLLLTIMFLQLTVSVPAFAVEYPNEDEGSKVIQEMSEKGQQAYEPVKDSEELAYEYLDKNGLNESWNDDKKIFASVGVGFFDSQNPSYDKSFVTARSLKSMEAILNAKARIIEYINSKMDAMDSVVVPGSDLNAEFQDEIDSAQEMMEGQKQELAALLEHVDKAEADSLRGATFGDRMNAAMDAAILKLDKEYSVAKIEDKKKKKFEIARVNYEKNLKKYKELEAKIKAYKGTITEEIKSKVETHSKMPLFGAIPVAQFESWDEESGQYKVAIVVMWSNKTERVARAFIQGEDLRVPPGKLSLREWIRSQNWSTATGGRRFRDNKGDIYFIGIAASAIGKSSSSERRARGVSEQNAKKEVAMSIFSDVASHKKAEQMLQTRSGGDESDTTTAAESFAQTVTQEIQGRDISGWQKFYGKKVVHPISQKKIYVTIYGVSGSGAKQALQMYERNHLTKILDIKSQKKLKGQKAAYKDKVNSAKADNSTYYKSKADTSAKVEKAIAKETRKEQPVSRPAKRYSTSESSNNSAGGRAQSGSYSGAGNSDLSW